MTVKLIVAVDKSNAIGWEDGRLPWKISADLKRFKELTMGHDIVMGRKTFITLPPKGLPGRRNIVLSRTEMSGVRDSGVLFIKDWDWVNAHQQCIGGTPPDIWIIGGAQVYKQALEQKLVDEIHLTLVDTHSNADVVFPMDLSDIDTFLDTQLKDGVKWSLAKQEDHLNDTLSYSFITLTKEPDDFKPGI